MHIPSKRLAPGLILALTIAALPAAGAAQTPTSGGADARTAAAPPRPAKPAETVTGTGPDGATMRCRDGSYPAPNAPDAACEAKGGVLVRFPVRRVPVTAPRTARRPVPTTAEPAPAPAPNAVAAPFESRAKVVVPATPAPANATFLCGDGTYVVADTSRARCATRGGVHLAFPRKPG